mmetsp:Transcript_101927/g.218255  ORF Transcript_101927/g.218255 Transcript_101927/m.218255 type:complete len:247 (+) Transcript_101927:1423-2163(+)
MQAAPTQGEAQLIPRLRVEPRKALYGSQRQGLPCVEAFGCDASGEGLHSLKRTSASKHYVGHLEDAALLLAAAFCEGQVLPPSVCRQRGGLPAEEGSWVGFAAALRRREEPARRCLRKDSPLPAPHNSPIGRLRERRLCVRGRKCGFQRGRHRRRHGGRHRRCRRRRSGRHGRHRRRGGHRRGRHRRRGRLRGHRSSGHRCGGHMRGGRKCGGQHRGCYRCGGRVDLDHSRSSGNWQSVSPPLVDI